MTTFLMLSITASYGPGASVKLTATCVVPDELSFLQEKNPKQIRAKDSKIKFLMVFCF